MTHAPSAILRRAIRQRMASLGLSSLLRWCPHLPHPKQLELVLAGEEEVLFGGAAGGGKSDAMLMRLLRYVDVPGYSAIAFRRTHTDLALAGSLMSRSHEWLDGTPAHWNGTDKVWTFPSGSKLTFAYLDNDNDRFRYKSAEFQQMAWDELTQFPNDLGYRFLFSRLRGPRDPSNPLSRVPWQSVAATNPGDAGHRWVQDRWGLTQDGEQPEEWAWVDPQQPNAAPERITSSSRRFIQSLLDDNPTIDADAYDRGLRKLDSTTYSQQRHGLWLIDGSHLVFKFDAKRNGIERLPQRHDWLTALGVDVGTSDSSPTTSFTRVRWNPHEIRLYVDRNWEEAGLDDDDVADRIAEQREIAGDGWRGAVIDTGGLGATYLKEARKRAGLAAEKAEKSDKQGFRKLLNGDLEKAIVVIVLSECAPLVRQLQTLIWNDQRTDVRAGLADHSADGLLYVWRKATTFLSRAPDQQPIPGTPAAVDAEARRQREQEKRRFKDRASRAPGEGW